VAAALAAKGAVLHDDVTKVGGEVSALAAAALAGGPVDATKLKTDLDNLKSHLDALGTLPDSLPGDVRLPLANAADRLAGLLGDDVDKFADTLAGLIGLRDELSLRFDWSPHLRAVSVFIPERDGVQGALLLSVQATAKSRLHPNPTLDVTARLTDFT